MFAKLKGFISRLFGYAHLHDLAAAAKAAEENLKAKVEADIKAALATMKADADKGLSAALAVLGKHGIKAT
ncbi:hypothetical protein ABZ746_06815 [Streptomyces sp. NPDC020096]